MSIPDTPAKGTSPRISKISMFLSAIFMGNVGLLITFLKHYPTHTIVLFRGISGTFFLSILLVIMIKYHAFSLKFLKESFKLHWKSLLIIGIGNPIIMYLYFESILLTNFAIAAFLIYLNGIFVLILLIITKLETVAKINIISFVLAIVGVALIMEFWTGQGITLGILLGIFSGITLAIQIYFMKRIYIFREKNPTKIKTKGNIDLLLAWWSTLFIIFSFLPLGVLDFAKVTLIDIGWILILGLIPTALAFVLYNIGIKNDKGGNILILAYFEPVVATINTVIFLHTFSIYTLIGGGLILLANVIILIFSRKQNHSTE